LATGSILSGLVAVNPLGAIKKLQPDDESGDHWTWIVIHWEHSDESIPMGAIKKLQPDDESGDPITWIVIHSEHSNGSIQEAPAGRRVRRLLDVDRHPLGAF
jgi:hypothetical protein